MSTTILVTGGYGFIGSHFIRLLLGQRASIRVVNLDKLTYAGNADNLSDVAGHPSYGAIVGDIVDPGLVDRVFTENRPEIVVNFAAESHVDRSILNPGPFLQTNVHGVQVLLDAVRRHSVKRYVQISTDEVYGDIPPDAHPADENAALRPSSPYSASKAAADLLCLAYVRTYGSPILIVRSSNNYGSHQFPEKLIPLTIRNALACQVLPVYGDGKQLRDWLFVEDNVEGILRVMDRGAVGTIYNIATETETANLDVVELLCDLVAAKTGRRADSLRALIRSVPDRPGHDRRYAALASRSQDELGWQSTTSLREGLQRTISWYLSNEAWLERVATGEYRRYYDQVYNRTWNQSPG